MDETSAWPRPDDPRWGPPPGDDDLDASALAGERNGVGADGADRVDGSDWTDEVGWTGEVGWTDEADSTGDPDWVGAEHEDLTGRLGALGQACRVLARYVAPAEAPTLAAATELAARGRDRLAIVGPTVVALAGPTGAGKSSVFNALAGLDLSPAGHLRPTTGEAYACVWGAPGADALLDWLGVPPGRRFARESPLDAEDEAALRGLVLIDLPDVDSLVAGNHVEADRLMRAVDRVIWVLDPQKYADQTVHDEYLRRMGALRGVTVVVLNQVDRLSVADADRCRADLHRLVAADGLAGVPVLGVSTVTGEGIGELRGLLEKVVADRLAAAARLEAELAEAVVSLRPLAPEPGPSEHDLSGSVPAFADDLAAACAIEALAADRRWPWSRRAESAVPAADPAAVGQAVRRLGERIAESLPAPWSRHVRAASTMDIDRLPEELARVLTAARDGTPAVWRPGRRRRAREQRMRDAVLAVAREVVAPLRQVLRDYAQVHGALERARPDARTGQSRARMVG